jgi:hypothetical protein
MSRRETTGSMRPAAAAAEGLLQRKHAGAQSASACRDDAAASAMIEGAAASNDPQPHEKAG